ncbi:MAG: hypothetical protein J7604_16725 [Sporocytophaga sp.]|uniref:hypothetical protein n=1 Tax=Sporocytophaga sp. TaxID=2231183 RepID=UPI001B137DF3|nr:hypothetical protein [Sporocytophaga sp.]MBO9701854.1 hypothetical protein [Sporocytophaga sp.]
MKKAFILLMGIFCFLFFSCVRDGEKKKDDEVKGQVELDDLTYMAEQIDNSHNIYSDSNVPSSLDDSTFKHNGVPVLFDTATCYNDSIPFGCSLLINHTFPKVFDMHSLDYSQPIKAHVRESYDVLYCFNFINEASSHPYSFSNQKFELVDVSKNKINHLRDSAFHSVNFYNYRLPDFNLYQCYYSCEPDSVSQRKGYLLFYHPKEEITRVLKVYERWHGEISSGCLCFFIDNDKRIHIKNFDFEETEATFSSVATVEILNSGEFKIIH